MTKEEKKEKAKQIATTLIVILAIVYFALSYPWIVSTDENGETTCYDLLNRPHNCG